MAKRRKVNKSAEIRQELEKTGGQGKPAEIVAILAERGVTVTAGHVANVKNKMKSGAGSTSGRGRGRKPAKRGANGAISTQDVQALLTIQRLVEQYGAKQVSLLVNEVANAKVPF